MKIKHDMKLLVAVGKSRMAKSWQNREILWSELLDKLSTTTRTRETVAEYAAMSKDDKNPKHVHRDFICAIATKENAYYDPSNRIHIREKVEEQA